jgi:surface antigen
VAWGNAKDWPAKAIAAGYPTGLTPRVGAVLICQPLACGGAFSLGHVAYVEQVLSSTSIQVSEQNWDAACSKDFRTVSVGNGMLFVYNLGDPLPPVLDHFVYLPAVLMAPTP